MITRVALPVPEDNGNACPRGGAGALAGLGGGGGAAFVGGSAAFVARGVLGARGDVVG